VAKAAVQVEDRPVVAEAAVEAAEAEEAVVKNPQNVSKNQQK